MTPTEIEAVLQAAFIQCETSLCPLSDQQKQILLQVVTESVTRAALLASAKGDDDDDAANPLDELTAEQRQALLQFVKEQEKRDRPWKIKLLNDWLHNRESGSVQFIRENYGPQWLNRVKPKHLAQYFAAELSSEHLKLRVGDRIEVSNGFMNSELLQQVRVLDPVSGTDQLADVLIADGFIKAIETEISDRPADTLVRDCQGLILGPGLVDLYSHSGEPGFEERETWSSLLEAAATGGFTRLAILPDTAPPVDNPLG
jgi:hypothetical protein